MLPAEMDRPPDRFVTVAWVYGQPELAVLLSLFAHEGIWVVPLSHGQIAVQFTHTVALGGVELCVREEDGPAARMLLAGIDRTPYWRGFFFNDRLLDILLMLVLFFLAVLAPPARIQASFVLDGPTSLRRDDEPAA